MPPDGLVITNANGTEAAHYSRPLLGIRSWEFKTFHDGVKAGTRLKPGA
jgi:hypothetical protein